MACNYIWSECLVAGHWKAINWIWNWCSFICGSCVCSRNNT
nr:hypothetical protein Iba_chr06aCG11050 [Ipomoea batatas]GMD53097.1 hypothetical protein Iba_scaffold47368CG0010 [Ipomoea batatas]